MTKINSNPTIPEGESSSPNRLQGVEGRGAWYSAERKGPNMPQCIANFDWLSSSILHDLRNPVATISASAEILMNSDLGRNETKRLAGNMHSAAARMRKLLTEISCAVSGNNSSAEICDISEVITAATEAASASIEHCRVRVSHDVPRGIELRLARSRMERVFFNLIVNAFEAMPAGGEVRICARQSGAHVVVEIEDTGPGIPNEIRERIFHPFVTAGKDNGLGLGLFLSRLAILDHGGDLWMETAPGARFVMRFPLNRVTGSECIVAKDRFTWTPELASVLGLQREGFTSNPQSVVGRIHPDDAERVSRELSEAMTRQQTEVIQEFRTFLPDGSRRMEARSRLLYSGSQKPMRSLGASMDVTEHSLPEIEQEQLIESERTARAAFTALNEDLQGFAHAVSHDLREPLRTIGVYTELLMARVGPVLDPESRNVADTIIGAIRQMQCLVDGLLRFCRVGYGPEAKTRVDAKAVVRGAIQHLRTAIEESDANITVHTLPTVLMNEQELLQVFSNLLANAIKFRRSSKPEIGVRAERQADVWRFSISDNGIGIDARYQEQIFGVFKRLHTSSEYEGAGIGLALVKRVIQRAGGQIWVESEPQKGSTFHFTIPAGVGRPFLIANSD